MIQYDNTSVKWFNGLRKLPLPFAAPSSCPDPDILQLHYFALVLAQRASLASQDTLSSPFSSFLVFASDTLELVRLLQARAVGQPHRAATQQNPPHERPIITTTAATSPAAPLCGSFQRQRGDPESYQLIPLRTQGGAIDCQSGRTDAQCFCRAFPLFAGCPLGAHLVISLGRVGRY